MFIEINKNRRRRNMIVIALRKEKQMCSFSLSSCPLFKLFVNIYRYGKTTFCVQFDQQKRTFYLKFYTDRLRIQALRTFQTISPDVENIRQLRDT